MNVFEQAEKLASAAAEIKQQIDQTLAKGTEDLTATVSLASQANNSARQQLATAEQAISDWQSEIAAFSTAGMSVANALKDLPRTAQALAEEMPKLARRLQTAGK